MQLTARSLLLVVAAALALPSSAQAVSSIGLVWEPTGTPTITIANGANQILRADLVITGDTAGVRGLFVSFRFDSDLGDELDVAGTGEMPCAVCGPGGTEQRVSTGGSLMTTVDSGYDRNLVESTHSNEGLLGTFEVLSAGSGVVETTITIGSIFFRTNAENITTDGVDVDVVILPDFVETAFDRDGNLIADSILLSGARVNLAPALPIPGWTWIGLGAALAFGTFSRLWSRR